MGPILCCVFMLGLEEEERGQEQKEFDMIVVGLQPVAAAVEILRIMI